MLHQCLTGAPPYSRGSEAAVLYAHLEEAPPAPPGLGSVVPRALAKNPADRYPSCRAFVADARDALGLEPRRARWPLAIAGIGAALIGAALLAFLLTSGGGGVPPEPGADSLVRIDPQTNEVVHATPVGRAATAVATGAGYVWVTSASDSSVWRITPSSGKVLKLAVNATPTDVGVTGGHVVVANGADGKVTVFDASTGASEGTAQLTATGPGSLQLSGGSGGLWFGAPYDHTVGNAAADVLPNVLPNQDVLVAPDGSSYLRSYRSFDGLAVGEGAVWVAGDAFGRTVWRVDPAITKVVATIPLPFVPMAIAAGGGGVWVTSLLDDTVSRIDPATNRIATTIPGPRGAYAIAANGAGVWVTGSLDNTLTRIDPRTNRVAARIALEGSPTDVASDGQDVWVIEGAP
jgi:YVTN family beta-propeller protein